MLFCCLQESSAKPFEEDFESYRLSTVGDGKVCSKCNGTAENVFRFADRQAGVNFPPMHPMCRCTFEIVVDDWNKWLDDYEKKHTDSGKQLMNRLNSDKEKDIIKTSSLPLNIQLFGKKASDFKTIRLPKKEYAHVMSEIATNITETQKNKKVFSKNIGDYTYTVENFGFGEYRVIDKQKIGD